MSDQPPADHTQVDHTKRDSESFLILGAFLAFLAVLVLLAAVFQAPGHARVVNFGAGFVLLAIGLAKVLWGLALRKRAR